MTTTVTQQPPDSVATATRPRVAMVCSALPPQLDGIGDYSAWLASAFSSWADVTLHTARGFVPDPIAGVPVVQSFGVAPRGQVADLLTAFDRQTPDWVILQYNPFCFGQKGFNPYLAPTFAKLKKKRPAVKLAVMVHERFMPANSPRNLIMWAYQYRQYSALTALADVSLFSTGPWFEAYRNRHPDRQSFHMPVGSNLPAIEADRDAVRRDLQLPGDAIILGSFGGNHPSRLFGWLAAAGRKLKAMKLDVRVLCIGSAGAAIKTAMPDLPVIDLGKLSAEQVARQLQAIDIYCSPFFDGVSTRRGSFFAGLQQGLATVTTRGYNSDSQLLSHADHAFIATAPGDESDFVNAVVALAEQAPRRKEMARQARICFDQNYSAAVLAQRWRELLLARSASRF